MKISCLINNYNYASYVGEAIESVLSQSRSVDEIIVVDDGSTDGSCELINRRFAGYHQVTLIRKHNAGQLSCFNHGIQAASGDLLFFLDADDRYRPDYIARAADTFAEHAAVDFLSVADQHFGANATAVPIQPTRNLGISALATLLDRKWIGGITSSLSMRSSLARKVLPCPLESEWRTRADDVLVFGSSIVGARKFHLGEHLVDYRVHNSNHFAGREFAAAEQMQHSLAVNRLIAWYGRSMGYDLERLPLLLHREFRTHEQPSWREWASYLRLVWRCRTPLGSRLRQTLAVTAHAVGQHARRNSFRQQVKLGRSAHDGEPANVRVAAS